MRIVNQVEKLKKLRPVVQGLFFAYSIFIGVRFYLFYLWITGASHVYCPRPPSVEAFLPISALLGFRQLLQTGHFDSVHPAGLTIFITIMVIAFFLKKGFCSWICPVGFLSNTVESIGRRLNIVIPIKRWVGAILSLPKYAFLAFFVYVVFFKMDIKAVTGFIQSPYNIAVDAKMLQFFIHPSHTTVIVLALLFLASFLCANLWCRFLCPYGALLGLLAFLGPTKISRNEKKCIGCKACTKTCPAGINVHKKISVKDPDCIGCLSCVSVCPQKDCLSVSVLRKKINSYLLPIGIVVVFIGAWLIAEVAGLWQSKVPIEVLKRCYMLSSSLIHPSY